MLEELEGCCSIMRSGQINQCCCHFNSSLKAALFISSPTTLNSITFFHSVLTVIALITVDVDTLLRFKLQ